MKAKPRFLARARDMARRAFYAKAPVRFLEARKASLHKRLARAEEFLKDPPHPSDEFRSVMRPQAELERQELHGKISRVQQALEARKKKP